MKTILIVSMLAILVGCANPLNRATAQHYTTMGDEATARGDYALAEVAFSRAVTNSDWGFLGPHVKSFTLVNLGVVKMYLGKYSEAESILIDARKMQDEFSISDSHLRFRTEIALADLYRLTERFDLGLPYVREFTRSASDFGLPSSWNGLCDAYAAYLRQIGLESDAVELEKAKRPIQPLQTTRYGAPRLRSCLI